MTENVTTGVDSAVSTQQTGAATREKVTLKYVVNRTHVGPVPEVKKAKRLSKAANKIKLSADLKLISGDQAGSRKDNGGKPGKLSYSEVLAESDSATAKRALLIVEAWSRTYPGVGTPEYVEKCNALNRERAAVYAELGITVQPGQRAPLLTEEQRMYYNKRILPFAFDYWEHRISYKVPGSKAIRTKVFRSCQEITPVQMRSAIQTQLGKVKELFKFS